MSAVAEEAATQASELGRINPSVPQPCQESCTLKSEGLSAPVLPEAQRRWASLPIVERLRIVRSARHAIASHAGEFASAISPVLQRSAADTLASEVLPLLDAMRFLERRAAGILATRRLGTRGRPIWLTGVATEVQRVPVGHVLVIGPANFPIFLPGVQAIQALVAGNSVTWKPGAGGRDVALLFANAMRHGGLPKGVLSIAEESVSAAENALAARPDKVIFTGSGDTGRKVMRTLAETATPSVMELSGADAVAVLPSADLHAAAKAIAFGLRLNGAEVCMSPRRLVTTRGTWKQLLPLLEQELAQVAPVCLKHSTALVLDKLIADAVAQGASVRGAFLPDQQRPLLVEGCDPTMAVTRTDVFAPVLAVLEATSIMAMPELINACPYGLTAAVFGASSEAKALGGQLRVGTVIVNDLIAPTADPRVPFAGRRESGFGATRGAEGLLAMTATRTLLVRRRPVTQHYGPVGSRETRVFTGFIGLLHGGTWKERLGSVSTIVAAAREQQRQRPNGTNK